MTILNAHYQPRAIPKKFKRLFDAFIADQMQADEIVEAVEN
jgi:hypothetical protein